MRLLFSLCAVLLFVLLLTGCHKPDSIVGKWQGTGTSAALGGVSYPIKGEYLSDGTADFSLGQATSHFNYTMQDTTLTETPTRTSLDGTNFSSAPTTVYPPQVYDFTLTGDTLVLHTHTAETTITLTRVKD